MTTKKTDFYATVRLCILVDVPLVATSFEDAVKKAKEITVKDVTGLTSYNDGTIAVATVSDNETWKTHE